jgi:methionine transaminase
MNIHSRLPDIGTTIFTVMSRMALDHGAINLSQGFPDFPIDTHLADLVAQAMKDGHNQYAPMAGVISLRQSIAAMVSRCYNTVVDPETEITITAGATEAIYSVVAAFVGAGDEVILFDPAYDSYNPAIRLNGGVPVHINLRYPQFAIDWDEVVSKITPRTRMIIINTPHNPLGTVLSAADLESLERIVLKHGLIVLSDEVYEKLIYDKARHESVLRYPGLAAQSFACFSFGKTFHVTGWKVGYVVGPTHLMKEVRKAHQYIVFSVNTPVQVALARYLESAENYEDLPSYYQHKRDFFLNELNGSSFEPLVTRGSYFQLMSYSNIAAIGDVEMAEELTRKHKVAAIPVSVFYKDKTDNKLLRFCFAKREETLAAAAAILKKI